MNLVESYEIIKPSIVAFTPKFHIGKPKMEFPPIFGTGFIVADGLVATNDHVIQIINKLPKPPDCPPEIWPVDCMLLHQIENKGLAIINLDVIGVFGVQNIKHDKNYMGSKKPDIAFAHVKMKNLPSVKIKYDLNHIKEGREIATAGFPMGTDTLTAPGYLHQLSPTLQNGIISAVLPFPCKHPHSLMINIMAQGGASGSPVFLPETADIIGVLYAGLEETRNTIFGSPQNILNDIKNIEKSIHQHIFKTPTNFSYVVPAHFIEKSLEKILKDENYKFPEDTESFDEYLKTKDIVIIERGKGIEYNIWQGSAKLESRIKEVLKKKST